MKHPFEQDTNTAEFAGFSTRLTSKIDSCPRGGARKHLQLCRVVNAKFHGPHLLNDVCLLGRTCPVTGLRARKAVCGMVSGRAPSDSSPVVKAFDYVAPGSLGNGQTLLSTACLVFHNLQPPKKAEWKHRRSSLSFEDFASLIYVGLFFLFY